MRAGGGGSGARWPFLVPLAERAFLLFSSAVVCTWLVSCRQAFVASYHAWPPPRVLVLLGAYVAAAVGLRRSRRLRSVELLLAGLLAAAWLGSRVQPLGDRWAWPSQAPGNRLVFSELLGNLAFHVAHRLGGAGALAYVAPIAGFSFTLLLRLLRQWFFDPEAPDAARTRALCCLAPLAGGWNLLFFRDYIENAQLPLPFLVLFLGALQQAAWGGTGRRRALVVASVWLAVAGLVHGESLVLLPVLLVAPFAWEADGDRARSLRDSGLAGAVWAGSVAGGIGLLVLAGFHLLPGHVGLERPIVLWPWQGERSGLAFWSTRHFVDLTQSVVSGAPLLLGLPLLALFRRAREAWRAGQGRLPVLPLSGCCVACFFFFIRFDLGFPLDADLMLALGAVVFLVLLPGVLALGRERPLLGGAVLALAIASTWATSAALLVPDGARPALGPLDPAQSPLLSVNGRVGEVHLRHEERTVVEVRSPAAGGHVHFALLAYVGSAASLAPAPGRRCGREELKTLATTPGVLLITDNLEPPLPAARSSAGTPWVSPLRRSPPMETTLQIVFERAPGELRAGNAVHVLPGPAG